MKKCVRKITAKDSNFFESAIQGLYKTMEHLDTKAMNKVHMQYIWKYLVFKKKFVKYRSNKVKAG